MKTLQGLVAVSLCLFIFGVHRVSAASPTAVAGALDNIVGSAQVVDSGGFGAGTIMWVEQDVTSTYTGIITSFSVVAVGGHIGSSFPLEGVLTNQTNGQGGSEFVNYNSICDASHDISVTSTECVVTFILNSPVNVTAGDMVTMRLDTNKQLGTNDTYYYASTQVRSPTWIAARIHLQNSGAGLTVPWDPNGGPSGKSQLAWAWNYQSDSGPQSGCTQDCNSNILFLPGIEGSRLYDASGKIWEPLHDSDVKDHLFLNQDGTSVRSDVYTKDVIDELPVTGLNIYKSFLDNLKSWKGTEHIIADYAVAPYDWRLSLDDTLNYGNQVQGGNIYYSGAQRVTSTPFIVEQLRTLAASSRTGKVTIVAHSLGGLVAKALLKKLKDLHDPLADKIDAIIFVAVPQVGTPQTIGALLHGYDLALPFSWLPAVLNPETGRVFGDSSPGAYQLIPTQAYFTGLGSEVGTSSAPVTFLDGTMTQPFITAYGHAITNASQLGQFLAGSDGRAQPLFNDLQNPTILSLALLTDAERQHAAIDDNGWLPSTSTAVYEVAGWGEDTLSSIEYRTGTKCTRSVAFVCTQLTPALQYSPKMVVDGDGTVVVPSALAMSTSTPNVTRWWIDLNSFNTRERVGIIPDIEHKNILEVSEIRVLIQDVVSQRSLPSFQYLFTSQPPVNSTKRLHFILHSPLALSARDYSGNEISATTSTLPDATYQRFGEVQYISLSASSTPTLMLTGYASGSFTLDVQEVIGNTIVATTTFSGIPCVTSTRVSMSFSDGTIAHASLLNVDTNGDGSTDFSLAPVTNGTVLPDLIAPEALITLDPVTKQLMITRTDNASPTSTPAILPSSVTSSTLMDGAGHATKLVYTKNERNSNSAFLTISSIAYDDGAPSSSPAALRYYWLPSSTSSIPSVLLTHIKTQGSSLLALYRAVTNKTTIVSATSVDDGMDLAALVAQLIAHPRSIIKQYTGLVVPFITTQKGRADIGY